MSESPWCHLDAPDLTRLDLAAVLVHEALGATPYLVGSCLERADYRDVDVRVLLHDDRFDALFPRWARGHTDPLLHIVETWFDEYFVRQTGLRIDFQIQRFSDANERYQGRRHPLGIYPQAREDQDVAALFARPAPV